MFYDYKPAKKSHHDLLSFLVLYKKYIFFEIVLIVLIEMGAIKNKNIFCKSKVSSVHKQKHAVAWKTNKTKQGNHLSRILKPTILSGLN